MMYRIPMSFLSLALALLVAGCETSPSPESPAGTAPHHPLKLEALRDYPVGATGGWDYLTVDPQARRVYIACSTRVMVLDADDGAAIGEVADTPGVHGIAIATTFNMGFTSNGRDGNVSVFDLQTLKTLRKIRSGQKPDAIVYDPASDRVWVINAKSGDITIIDPVNLDAAPVTLAVGGKLECAAADGAGRLYVNVEEKGDFGPDNGETVVIDTKAQKIVDRWSLGAGSKPTGLALDAVGRRVFVGCSNQKMVVLNADTGKILATLPIGSGVDGVAYDAGLGVALSANGQDGTVTVIGAPAPGTAAPAPASGGLAVLATVPTIRGARTIANDPKTHCFYLPHLIASATGTTRAIGVMVVGAGITKWPSDPVAK